MASLSFPKSTSKRKIKPFWPVVVSLLLLLLLGAAVIPELDLFPESWNIGLREPFNEFKRWVVINRTTHWMFVFFFEPLSNALDFIIRLVENFLLWLPWPVTMVLFFWSAHKISGLRLALLVSGCLFLMGMFGLWEASMQTLALMTISVVIALGLGIPLGIWSARSERVEWMLRPVLDAMQTVPIFVYLIPVVLFFGIARVPSAIATIVYALPPAIRLTSLGIRRVPADALEAADAFGSTDRQKLIKVQIPMAMPSIMAGVNQTIMMALSIVVLAALIGSGGLGDVVLKALRRLQVGVALEAGLAIVVMAILLDRFSVALGQFSVINQASFRGFRLLPDRWRGIGWVDWFENGLDGLYRWIERMTNRLGQLLPSPLKPYQDALLFGAFCLFFLFILLLSGVDSFPEGLNLEISRPVDALVSWMQVNLYEIGNTGLGTGPFRDFLIIRIFLPLADFLTNVVPWPVILLVFGAAAWQTGRRRLTVGVILMLLLIGLTGMWSFAMDTLGQTLVAVIICVLIGIPLGIWASRSNTVDRLIRPILDFLQTIPIFVYLVPVIMLFGSGSVAGLIASVLYAVVPVIRLTNLGIRQVDQTILESAEAFGSTSWQRLLKVEVPLAAPSIMLGINQTIMMALAMVIIAGLVGATGLGLEVVQGFANNNLGRSVEAGLAIVLLAMVIDRITEAWAEKAAQAANL
ncbi:MAG: ABC transporter permease subunit [Ardenticatenaceae bacterium]|nr:ABC transporter permease subunit [Ardenticatenaceae bacterium]